jgi:hypothetical protein
VTSRGIRNNNPGNIEKSSIPWRGKVPGTDPRFETFDTPHNGIRALALNLLAKQDKHGKRTVREIISAWAPPNENDTEAYIRQVAFTLGVKDSDQLDLHRASVLGPFVMAVIRHENGTQPYFPEVISRALVDALGIEPKAEPVQSPPPSINSGQPPIVDKPKEPRMALRYWRAFSRPSSPCSPVVLKRRLVRLPEPPRRSRPSSPKTLHGRYRSSPAFR